MSTPRKRDERIMEEAGGLLPIEMRCFCGERRMRVEDPLWPLIQVGDYLEEVCPPCDAALKCYLRDRRMGSFSGREDVRAAYIWYWERMEEVGAVLAHLKTFWMHRIDVPFVDVVKRYLEEDDDV